MQRPRHADENRVTPADLQEAAQQLTGTIAQKNQGVLSQPPDSMVELRGFEPLTS